MRGMVCNIGRSGGFVAPVLALLLLFRILIPAGYMIAPGQAGLVLCEAVAPAPHGDHDRHSPAPAPAEAGKLPCPFAALGSPPVPPAPPLLLAPPTAEASPQAPIAPGIILLRALAAPPPPATGPPPLV